MKSEENSTLPSPFECLRDMRNGEHLHNAEVCFIVRDDVYASLSSSTREELHHTHVMNKYANSVLPNCFLSRARNVIPYAYEPIVDSTIDSLLDQFDDENVGGACIRIQGQTAQYIGRIGPCLIYVIEYPLAFGVFSEAPYAEQIHMRNVKPSESKMQFYGLSGSNFCLTSIIVAKHIDGSAYIVKTDTGELQCAFDSLTLRDDFSSDMAKAKIAWKYRTQSNTRTYVAFVVLWRGFDMLLMLPFEMKVVSKHKYLSEMGIVLHDDNRGGARHRQMHVNETREDVSCLDESDLQSLSDAALESLAKFVA